MVSINNINNKLSYEYVKCYITLHSHPYLYITAFVRKYRLFFCRVIETSSIQFNLKPDRLRRF